jgi:ribosomal protein S18 acetylase RimI-like enzyme
MPEFRPSQPFVDAAKSGEDRIGRVNNDPRSYDESRDVEEYGSTPDFSAAKAAREAGVQVNRYPGKCFNCSKSVAPGRGETVHISKVPQEKRRAGSNQQWMTKCAGDSCVTKAGRVKGPAERSIPTAVGSTVQKAKIGKSGGGHHTATIVHNGQTSSMSWHPRSGVIQTMDIHPEHQGIGMEDRLMRDATATASREGLSIPRHSSRGAK